jgi:hypothetical protein
MPAKPKGRAAIKDPAGEAWHAEAGKRWAQALKDKPDAPLDAYDPHPLPTWAPPAHVTREVLGRFLHDRDTGMVHDVEHALESCYLDNIQNGTFIHFASELDGALPADAVDCACMGG